MLMLYKGITGTLFGLAILTATVRTVYRVQIHGRLMLDDLVLIFACATLTAANGILFFMIPTIYWDEELILNTNSLAIATAGSAGSITAFSARLVRVQKILESFATLIWTTIFAVKICFLLFFLQMIHRLKNLMFIWKIVLGITIPSYCVCVAGIFLACFHYDLAVGKFTPFL